MLLNLALIIVAITMVALSSFMICVFSKIRKTAVAIRDTLARAENELKPVLHELYKTLAEIKSYAEGLATRTEDLKAFMEALGNTGRDLRMINKIVGTVVGILTSSFAWVVGAKVAGRFILERLSQKKRRDNMANDEHGTSAGTLLLSFLAGAAVGAGLSLLYAPKTGKKLRENIGELTDDAVDKIKTYATEAQEKIKSTIEEGKEVIMEKKAILTSAIEAGKEAMEREKDKYRDNEA